MTNFLIKIFIKDYKNTKNSKVREEYGVLASSIGVFSNIILFIIKIVVGTLVGSISVVADAFNNLVDSLASLISLMSFKFSSRPADEEHPFGHGRVEYIATMVVAFFVAMVSIEMIKSSISKILHPESITASVSTIVILFLTILINLGQVVFYNNIGKKINSKTLTATAKESFADIITTIATIISIGFVYFFKINIDGFVGLILSVFIIKMGYEIAKDTMSAILGESVNEELSKEILDEVSSYSGIIGVHDLIVHNYGPNKYMATLHAEVPANENIMISHEIIDTAEREVGLKLGIHLTLHMDPIDTEDPLLEIIRIKVKDYLDDKEFEFGAHDFRFIKGHKNTNVIFDLEIPYKFTVVQKRALTSDIMSIIKSLNDSYNCVINLENKFVKS